MSSYVDIARVLYHTDQLLKEADFTQDQDFHVGQRDREDRLARLPGVAQGLLVQVSGTALLVTAGGAFDDEGRLLLLAPPGVTVPRTIGPHLADADKTPWDSAADGWSHDFAGTLPAQVNLYIQWDDSPTAPESSSSSYSSSSGSPMPDTRYQQTPILDIIDGNIPSGAVLIAQIDVDNGAFVSPPLYQPRRTTSGLALGPPVTIDQPERWGTLRSSYEDVTKMRLDVAGKSGVRIGFTDGQAADPTTGVLALSPLLELMSGGVAVHAALSANAELDVGALTVAGLDITDAVNVAVDNALDVPGAIAIAAGGITVVTDKVSFTNPGGVSLNAPPPGLSLASSLFLEGNRIVWGDAAASSTYVQEAPLPPLAGTPLIIAGPNGVGLGVAATPETPPALSLIATGSGVQIGATLALTAGSINVAAGSLASNGDVKLEPGARLRSARYSTRTIPFTLVPPEPSDPMLLAKVEIDCHGGTLLLTMSGWFSVPSSVVVFADVNQNFYLSPKDCYGSYTFLPYGGGSIAGPTTPVRKQAPLDGATHAMVGFMPAAMMIENPPVGTAVLQLWGGDAFQNVDYDFFSCTVTVIELPF